MAGPRVAVLGVMLESNRFAPPATMADVESGCRLAAAAILDDARGQGQRLPAEARAFIRTMDATGPWQPVPVVVGALFPAGPMAADLMADLAAEMRAGLEAAGPLDAAYVVLHGAMLAEGDDDPDGTLLRLVRSLLPRPARLVVTLDLHANVSEAMVEAADLVVGYRTNPHVDQRARGEEAAQAIRLMLAGEADPRSAFIRLPIAPPTVTLLTAEAPYGTLIDLGQRRLAEAGGRLLNVSIFGGFVFSDTAHNGLGIVVAARDPEALGEARRLACELARKVWAEREGFVRRLMPLAEAVDLVLATDREPVIFSDAGDNPGGGGTGRTTELLRALVEAGAEGVLYGSFFEPGLAAAAHEAGLGAMIEARFNAEPGTACDTPFTAPAEVLALGAVTGRLGLYAGRRLHLGLTAALRLGGVTVVVVSGRAQTADPVFFEMLGLEIAKARTVVVKSRGHFRAGFLPWFPPERVHEVDTAGLTSPVLERFAWQGLKRPIYPLDPETDWQPPPWCTATAPPGSVCPKNRLVTVKNALESMCRGPSEASIQSGVF
jgi:microcystin degradation protein MlrC